MVEIAKGNPISLSEINRLKKYRNKIAHGMPLSEEEMKDFKQIIRKVREELPPNERDDFDSIVIGILGFIGGLLLAALLYELLKGEKK